MATLGKRLIYVEHISVISVAKLLRPVRLAQLDRLAARIDLGLDLLNFGLQQICFNRAQLVAGACLIVGGRVTP